jgi:hypothetical protein
MSIGAPGSTASTVDDEPMCRQMTVPSSSQAQLAGALREGHRVAALLGDPPDLLGHQLGVPDRRDRQRHEPVGVGAAPLVDVPVVVGPDHVHGHVEVLGLREQLAAELHEAREVHGGEHAVAVHVLDPLVDVPAAPPDPAQGGGLDAVLLGLLARHRVEADVRDLVPLVDPHVGAVVLVHELRRELLPLLGKVVVEERGRLDDVVVDADQDQVIGGSRHGSYLRIERRVGQGPARA